MFHLLILEQNNILITTSLWKTHKQKPKRWDFPKFRISPLPRFCCWSPSHDLSEVLWHSKGQPKPWWAPQNGRCWHGAVFVAWRCLGKRGHPLKWNPFIFEIVWWTICGENYYFWNCVVKYIFSGWVSIYNLSRSRWGVPLVGVP